MFLVIETHDMHNNINITNSTFTSNTAYENGGLFIYMGAGTLYNYYMAVDCCD